MALSHIMLILTLLADGQLSAAFVSTGDRPECEARAVSVGSILKSGGADVQQIQCLQSARQFVKFSHATAATAPRFRYVLTVKDGVLEAAPAESAQACEAARAGSAADQYFCVTSTQALQ